MLFINSEISNNRFLNLSITTQLDKGFTQFAVQNNEHTVYTVRYFSHFDDHTGFLQIFSKHIFLFIRYNVEGSS